MYCVCVSNSSKRPVSIFDRPQLYRREAQRFLQVRLLLIHILTRVGFGHVATTSRSLMSHMDSYLPLMGPGGPDMFLRSLLLTIKPVALSIHHSDWQHKHPTMSVFPLHCKVIHRGAAA